MTTTTHKKLDDSHIVSESTPILQDTRLYRTASVIRSSGSDDGLQDSDAEHYHMWVQQHFHEKDCFQFRAKDDKTQDKCVCGRKLEGHQNSPGGPPIREAIAQTFGSLRFVTSSSGCTPKYIRVSDETPDEPIVKLLLEKWDIPPPNIILSLTGAALNFDMDDLLEETFMKGLMEAALPSKGWLITGGTNAGVMKKTGEALQKHDLDHKVPCLGVATWGVIDGRGPMPIPAEAFVADKAGKFVADDYTVNYTRDGTGFVDLQPNHTHFVFVDNGTSGQFGAEMGVRARLEAAVGKEVNAPVVVIVVQGGPGTITTCYEAFLAGTPILTVKGSGQAADLLADSYDLWWKKDGEKRRKELSDVPFQDIPLLDDFAELVIQYIPAAAKAQSEGNTKFVAGLVQKVVAIVRERKSMQVFSLSTTDGMLFDYAIFKCILQCTKSFTPIDQLKMCVRWGRADLARQEVLSQCAMSPEDYCEILLESLLANDVEMARVAFDGGDLRYFKILRLYTAVQNNFNMKGLRNRRPCTIETVSEILCDLLGDNYVDELEEREGHGQIVARDLFIWAVVNNNIDMAGFLWTKVRKPVECALIGVKINHSLAEQSFMSSEQSDDQMEYAKIYEQWALGVLQNCFDEDPERTQDLMLAQPNRFYDRNARGGKGKFTCVDLAVEAEATKFVAHPSLQDILTDRWTGQLDDETPAYKIVLTILFPFLLFAKGFLKWEAPTDGEQAIGGMSSGGLARTFFSIPVTKFWIRILAYIVFLGLYVYVSTHDFLPVPSWQEILLFIWVLTMVLDEIRQIVRSSFSDWASDGWNQMDFVMITFYMISIAFRFHDVPLSKEFMGLGAIIFFLRLLNACSINENLGPLLVMIARMVIDILLFLFILFVAMLGFGVAYQAILYPHGKESAEDTREVMLVRPYFQIYGELFLDELSSGDPGGRSTYLAPLLLALYMIISNVLLLNLLIAMLSDTYSKVKENSLELWRSQRYSLIVEYERSSILPPPLIIISIFHDLWKKARHVVEKDDAKPYSNLADARLARFVQNNREKFLETKALDARSSEKGLLTNTITKIERVLNLLLEDRQLQARQIESLREEISELKK